MRRPTRADLRLLGMGALGVLLPVLLLALSSVRTARQETAAARAQLASARAQLALATSLVTAGQRETAAQRARIDSLWGVIAALRTEVRRRQRTTPAQAPTGLIATLVAERDTAIADRDAALAQLAVVRETAGQIRQVALVQLVRDSTRLAQIGMVLDSATVATAAADRALHPPWYRRLGGALKAGGRAVVIGTVGYALGRLT